MKCPAAPDLPPPAWSPPPPPPAPPYKRYDMLVVPAGISNTCVVPVYWKVLVTVGIRD